MLYFDGYKIDLDIYSKFPIDLALKYSILIIGVVNQDLVVYTPKENKMNLDILKVYFDQKVNFKYIDNKLIEMKLQEISELKNNKNLFNEEIEVKDDDVVSYLNETLNQALILNATDIHIEPYEKYTKIRYRINGRLEEVDKITKELFKSITSRIKLLSNLDISEIKLPQDGRISLELKNRLVDIRVATIPTNFGEKIVLRILDKSKFDFDLNNLGIDLEKLSELKEIIHQPYGLILFTGPAGSGKTTTMYSILKELNDNSKNIVTLEDPIEYTIDNISQSQINEKIGYTFDLGFKSILRQDPDIIMVGEIRDDKVANMVLRGAITGHLILSTLHTNDCLTTLLRLKSMGIKEYLISAGLLGIVSQRLVGILCDKCKSPVEISDKEKEYLGISTNKVYKANGCKYCRDGYYKRKLIVEMLKIDDDINKFLGDDINIENFYSDISKSSLKLQSKELLINGKIDVEEYLKVSLVL